MKAKRQILSLLLALVMVWQGFSFANAASSSDDGTGVVTATEISVASASSMEGAATEVPLGKRIDNAIYNPVFLINNKTVEDGSSLANFQSLQFKANLKVKDLDINEGDYISIGFPDELLSKDLPFEVKGRGGVVLAKAKYIQESKEMRIVFTQAAKTYNGTDGEIFFNTKMDESVVKENTTKPLVFTVNGSPLKSYSLNYTIVGKDDPVTFWKSRKEEMIKVKDKDGATHYLIQYTVSIDERHIKKESGADSFKNVVLTDKLESSVLSYFDVKNKFSDYTLEQSDIDTYTPKLRKGIWRSGEWKHGVWVNAPSDVEPDRGPKWSLRNKENNEEESSSNYIQPKYAEDGRSFTIPIGTLEPGDGFYYSYYVEVNEAFKNGNEYYNRAILSGDGLIETDQRRQFIVNEAGGFLNGQIFNIKIQKTGENGEALSGAKFTVVNSKTKYAQTVETSGTEGTAELNDVLLAEYIVTEVEAPEGYELDSTPKTISVKDFKDSVDKDSTVVLEFKNRKKMEAPKEKESVNISVKKNWVLDPALATNKPEKVKVSVLKNGVEDENLTVELSAANGWKASFSNLPKEDANGQEIVYTVSEEEVAGFKAAISGTADYGFTISNYHGGKVVIPVTKIWRGEGNHPDSLKVYLYADGTKVATYTLNQANGWQHQFEAPKYKADGTVIRYTVMEEQVNGYSSSTQGDPVTGYVNVFTNTKTPTTPPVTPPTTPSEIPPVTPGGNNPRTPGGGGNTPNNPGGGGNTPNNPGGGGNTPNPPTPPSENPGEVLAANRTPEGNVLGAERPTVLGVGRGYTKTEDSRNIWVNLALFAIAGLSFYTILVLEKRRNRELY